MPGPTRCSSSSKRSSTWIKERGMASGQTYLAIDLGAESGRAILGTLKDGRLSLAEAHRFGNGPVRLNDGLHWDVLGLWAQIKSGIAAGVAKSAAPLEGIGLDTWGVDFALLERTGALLSNPFHYRDTRTDGMLEQAYLRMSRADILAHTGIQFMQINTLYQLLAMVVDNSPVLEVAETFLTVPDLFNYWLSGEIACEFTIATTTQCYDPHRRDWAWPVIEALGIPKRLFGKIIRPGSLLGPLAPAVAEEVGGCEAPVVAPACHDTGSAVVAVPAEGKNFAWISSGTWSIIGAETLQPATGEKALDYNFTNEGGVFGTWRLSKNIMGLWLVQECKRAWSRAGEDLSYDEITRLAAEAKPFTAVIDPDDSSFLHPGDMPARIRAYCQKTGQRVPETKGEIVRTALESLALKYRRALSCLEDLVGVRLEPVHIIGGGTQNGLLNQLSADALGRSVIAGPVEAT
ncbi:MAG: rhamnulokinase, partial [Chloroflexota bacterium]